MVSRLDEVWDNYCYPHAFMDFVLRKQFQVHVLSKKNVASWIEEISAKPKAHMIYVNPRHSIQDDDGNTGAAKKAKKELESGSVYVKPAGLDAHAGEGIIRIEKGVPGLTVSTARKEETDRIKLGTANMKKEPVEDKKTIFPLDHRQGELEIIRRILESTQKGNALVEKDLSIPLYQGRTWEIRTIIQKMRENPQVVGHYAKIGGDEVSANISTGGYPEEAVHVVSEITRKLHPQIPEHELGLKISGFFRKSNQLALKAYDTVNRNMTAEFMKHVSGIPPNSLEMTDAACDIAAVIDPETRELKPIIMEFPTHYACTGFEKADPVGHKRMQSNREHLQALGRRQLNTLLG